MEEPAMTLTVAQQDAETIVKGSGVASDNVMHLSRRSCSRGEGRQRASSRKSQIQADASQLRAVGVQINLNKGVL